MSTSNGRGSSVKTDRPSREVNAMMALIKGKTDLEIAEIATGIAPNAEPGMRIITGDVTKNTAIVVAAVRALAR